jgi:hypothetical protein
VRIEVKIITTDYEMGFHLTESPRFPGRRPLIVPGEATIVSQDLTCGEGLPDEPDIIELGIEVDEGTSIDEFAGWLYSKLKERAESIRFLSIAGKEIQVDEAQIKNAIESGVKTA